jgi:hypothetical protein
MTRNRSTRKMRNRRNKSRSKRGGLLGLCLNCSPEKKQFKTLKKEGNPGELCEYISLLSHNVTSMVSLYNELNDEDKSTLVDCFSDGLISGRINQKNYMENYRKSEPLLFGVINDAVMEKKPDESQSESQPSVGLAAEFANTSSQSPSTLPPKPSDKVTRMNTPNFNPGFKNSSKGGKSRRHRRRRHRTIKNRKSRKGHRTRRNKLRNKRGGMHSLFQHGLLPEYKRKLRSSSLNDLLQNFKDSGQTKLDQETINEIDTVYDSKSKTGELNIFLLKLNTEQVGELLQNIKDQTTEGKAFYRYVLLKFLADNGRAEAQSILGGMFEIGEGVPLDRDKGLALLKSAGAHGDANVRADWSTYVSGL